MEQLKVRKKDPAVINAIIYLMLSFLFLYLQYAYRHQLSPVSVTYLRKSLELFWYVVAAIAVSSFMLWRLHPLANGFFAFCSLLVSFKVVEGLFIEFNKIIVIALFFYVVISYFLYQLLQHDRQAAAINPNYLDQDLFPPLLRQISCQVRSGEQLVAGELTNWDEHGCFIKLHQAVSVASTVDLVISFQGKSFQQQGEVVAQTLDLTGVGLKFKPEPKDLTVFKWSEFTELIHELGFKPERLR